MAPLELPLPGNPNSLKLSADPSLLMPQFMAPLLAGNCKLTILSFISANADNYLDTMNVLRVSNRAMSLTAALQKTRITLAGMAPFLSAHDVLSIGSLDRNHTLSAAADDAERHVLEQQIARAAKFSLGHSPSSDDAPEYVDQAERVNQRRAQERQKLEERLRDRERQRREEVRKQRDHTTSAAEVDQSLNLLGHDAS